MASTSSTRARAGIAVGSALAALIAGWYLLARPGSGEGPVRFDGDTDSARDLLLERAGDLAGATIADDAGRYDEPPLRLPISEEEVFRIFPRPSDLFVYDPHAIYRYKGGLDAPVTLPDYPGGGFRKVTSEEGYDEDFERLPEDLDFLAVATGDSHTDGMCVNAESFPNRLEAALRERHPDERIEVLNTGATGYSFYNYLGVLEKLLSLRPRAFVVAFYSGNDFVDVVKPWHFYHRTALPPRRLDYWEKLDRVKKAGNGALANALHQVLFFQYHPEEVENALTAAAQVCGEIQRICEREGIRLWFVHVPVAFRVDGELHPELARAKELLELSDYDLGQVHRVADRLIEVLRRRGADVIDLREAFGGDLRGWYWSDLHINVRAHQKIADLLRPRFEAAFFAEGK